MSEFKNLVGKKVRFKVRVGSVQTLLHYDNYQGEKIKGSQRSNIPWHIPNSADAKTTYTQGLVSQVYSVEIFKKGKWELV